MKTHFSIWLVIALVLTGIQFVQGQGAPGVAGPQGSTQTVNVPAPTPYAVSKSDANSRVWGRTVYEAGPSGQIISHQHSYTELATGLNHLVNGQWVESSELIDIQPDGTAQAVNGQHQAYFPGDIYQGQIKVVTPDGVQLHSRPLGLSYFDGTNSVMIAELTNSIGVVVGNNVVIYPNAFTDFKADLRYTYRKGGFEQDIVLKQQPPMPESFGLNSKNTRLQLLTEFFNTPDPVQTPRPVIVPGGLSDNRLAFGQMKMLRGKAFMIGNAGTDASPFGGVPVYKSWQQLEGRTFLVEELPVPGIAAQLEQLPLTASAGTPANQPNTPLRKVAARRLLPPARLVQAGTNTAHLARADINYKSGLVLDYVAMDATASDFTFQGDTTYLVSGEVDLTGITTFEGGTVIKYDTRPDNSCLQLWDNVICDTAPYRPAVFTSFNDNSVGENLSVSGSPVYYDSVLSIDAGGEPVSLHDLRISYTAWGLHPYAEDFQLSNAQFVNCLSAFDPEYLACTLDNVLMSDVPNAFDGTDYQIAGSQVTIAGCGQLTTVWPWTSPSSSSLTLTNSLLVDVTNGSVSLATNYTAWTTNASLVFQTVGAGSYYLADGSPYRNAGTTNIDPGLLAGLATKTTWPPVVYDNWTITEPVVLSPQAPRDTNAAPDLGYHYDPLDFVFGGCDLYYTLTFTPGTAVGWYDEYGSVYYDDWSVPYAISLNDGANLTATGTANQPCWIVKYNTVQEGDNGNWTDLDWLGGIIFNGSGSDDEPQLNSQFTKWSMLADYYVNHICNNFGYDVAYGVVNVANDEFYGGGIYTGPQCYTNCLFFRTAVTPMYDTLNITFQNCTFYNGLLELERSSSYASSMWTVKDTAFDGTAFYTLDGYAGDTNHTSFDYNAYLSGSNTLETVGAHDLTNVVSYNWEGSWFGDFYLPDGSPLIDMGSTTADQVGLYHFTTQTNQVPETNSIVDIGYHYVATDAYGNPLDSNGDGIPDYLEDANGNGLVDNDETNWALAILTQPANQTAIQGSNATFNVTADGIAPLSYQWWFNGTTQLAGATNTSLTLTSVQPTNAGNYSVVVTNNYGSVTSSIATLTVLVPPAITTQPTNQTALAGGTGIFAVVASGTAQLSYQWQKNGVNLTDGGDMFGANSNTLTFTNLMPSDAGMYSVLVTNVAGIAISFYAVLRVWTPSSVVFWGYDDEGQSDVPSDLTNAVAIATGAYHCLALKSDGTVVGWGSDYYGETDVPSGLTNVVAVAAGESHSLALKSDGTVVGWGWNGYSLTNPPAGLSNVVAIAAGDEHNLALKSDGTVVAWGSNGYGQTNVPAGLGKVLAIAASQIDSLALKSNGTVVVWGSNEYGQTNVPTGLTNAVAIAGGDYFGLALKNGGMVVGWGATLMA